MKPAKTLFELLTFYHFVDIPEDEVESVVADHLSLFAMILGLRAVFISVLRVLVRLYRVISDSVEHIDCI